ncbi:hypothetical protein ACQEU8_36655 [Streptomyces sp. CA-250714]|uniref:hypothetical protein n=1 Tax=Streptomyces sp. CA-250714 TaxID=3240060 RepID=UPI003D909F57
MTEQPSPPRVDPEAVRVAVEQMRAVMRAYVEAITPALHAAARAAETARTARRDDYALAPPPATPRDRPAWQSPHGPAHTRRK